MPPEPCENVESKKNSTRNMGRHIQHQQIHRKLMQLYSLTDEFLYNYNYKFTIPKKPTRHHVIAKASLHAYKI